MFTADNVLGVGTAVFGDLSAYLESLHRMKGAAEQLSRPAVRLYPGHGGHIEDGVAALREYIEHRMSRVRQVAALLEGSGRDKQWTAEAVTREIYRGVPEELIAPATQVTTLVLRKLAADGAVLPSAASTTGPVTWRTKL